ncbi:YrhC family protein, partial [Bacillus paranthracis]
IPNGAKETIQFFVMMGSIVIFLSLSFFFFQRVKVMRDKLEGNECE